MKFKLEKNVQDFIEINTITWFLIFLGWALLVVIADWCVRLYNTMALQLLLVLILRSWCIDNGIVMTLWGAMSRI